MPDDEDGVTFGTIQVGQAAASVTVNVQNAPGGALLNAWIDFNADGSWGAEEQIADNFAVVNGNNTVVFDVPGEAASGTTYARFRLSTAGDLAPAGAATDGEVEDYQITLDPTMEVDIDVKPGSDHNPISLNSVADSKKNASHGVVPVVLFATPGFDAATVDVSTLLWAGAGVHHSSLEDVDNDGDLDLVMKFRLRETNLLNVFRNLADPGGNTNKQSFTVTTELSGQTTGGGAILGTDEVDLLMTGKTLRDLLDGI